MAANDILVKIGADITQFSRAMADSQKQLTNFSKANKDTFDAFKKTGAVVTGTGIALAGGLGIAVGEAIKFEDSFAGVRKTVDASEAEFAELSQGFRDLAQEIPASIHEINAVGEAAGQLGIDKENILGFTRTMIDLGVATNMSSDEAATALARLANITGMPQTEFDRLGSTIVDLGNNLATTESEIVEMGLRLAGAGKQVGMTEAEILSFSAALSSVGIEAEAGGSAFSKVMVNMQLAAEQGGDDLENFAKVAGMSAEEFKQAYQKDAAGALSTFIEGLATAEERGVSAIGVLDEMGITEVRMRDALLRAAGASDVFTEALDIGTSAWEENTALSDEAAERYKTMASQLEILKNTVIDTAISFGEALVPAVQKVVEWAQKLAEWFTSLSDSTKSTIAFVTAIASALMLVVGPFLLLIGFIPNIIAGFSAIITVVKAVGSAIALIASPIGLVVTAVIGMAYLIYRYWDEIKAFTIEAWGAIAEFFVGLWQSIKDGVVTGWQAISEYFVELWESIKEVALTAWDGLVSGVMTIVQPFIDGIMNIFNNMKDGLETLWSGLVDYFTGAWDLIKNIFLGAVLLILNLVTGNFEELSNNTRAIWNNIKDALGQIWEGIKGIFSGALSAIWGFVTGAWQNIKTNTTSIFNTVKETITDIWNGIKTFFTTTLSDIWNTVKQKFTDIVNTVREKMDDVKQRIEDGWNKAKAFLEGIDLKQIGKDIIDGLISGITSKVEAVKDAVKNVTDSITGKIKGILGIKSPSRVLAQIGRWTGEGLANGIEDTAGLVERASDMLGEAAIPDQRVIDMTYATPIGLSSTLASAVRGTVDVNDSRDEALVRAIGSLERRLGDLEVVMDGERVGRIVTPHVNEGNAVDANVRRYFG